MSCEEALSIEDEMIVYLSNLLAANLIENELLRESMRSFLPGSIARTHFGIEIDNPFLSDITQSYASLLRYALLYRDTTKSTQAPCRARMR